MSKESSSYNGPGLCLETCQLSYLKQSHSYSPVCHTVQRNIVVELYCRLKSGSKRRLRGHERSLKGRYEKDYVYMLFGPVRVGLRSM